MNKTAIQACLDGSAELVLPRSKGQQLALFGQGEGGTLALPNGELVKTKQGLQLTLHLRDATA